MSVLYTPTPLRQSHYPARQAAMTIAYPDHSSLSYGLITPPSEMRTTDDSSMDPNNILAPSASSRYYLRKQSLTQTLYPAGGNYNYNSYVQARRRSMSSSTTNTSTSGTTAGPLSPPLDFESRDFNLGEFTATMVCFLWFEPIAILDHASSFTEHATNVQPLGDDAVAGTEFIDFCKRVIRTTAVSKEVAILGLLFIHRLRLRNPNVDGKSGSQWRIFTIALMLGNKILDDNTYTNKTWADVTKILHASDIKIMEVEFLSQMRYNLFVSPQQWEEWKTTVSRMYSYHREGLRQRALPKKVFYSNKSMLPSPPVSTASPSFEQQYLPISSSPFRMQFPQQMAERHSSPHRPVPPMDDSPSSASAAVHARVSRKRSREDASSQSALQPPSKRYQQYTPGPLGNQLPPSIQQQRIHYPTDSVGLQHQYPQQGPSHSRVPLTLSLPDPSQTHSPSYPLAHQYAQPISPSFPTSPYAASPLSPYSTANSYHESLSPYANIPHRQMPSTPQPHLDTQSGYASGYSSPYKYLQNRFSPYAPVRPARTLPSQFIPPRVQWSNVPPEDLWYQPLGMHGQQGLRRGVPVYNEFQNYQYQSHQ